MARFTAVSVAAALGFLLTDDVASACPAPWGIITFDLASATLSGASRDYLASFLPSFSRGGSIIRLSGHADRVGSTRANLVLSRRRAEAARDHLVSLGVPNESVELVALGEGRPMVETRDGVEERQNRYVLIEEIPTLAEGERRFAELAASGDTIIC